MFNFVGAFFSVLSSIKQSNDTPLIKLNEKYSVLMTGQVFCSIATPFSFLVTTKFANTWFSPNQRAIANTIALVSATFGILIGALISPLIVNNETDFENQMLTLNLTNCAISLVPAVLTVFITRSTPPIPPTHENSNSSKGLPKLKFYETFCIYFKQTRKLFKSVQFWILFFTFSICFGLFNTLAILLQQILCVRGYTDGEVGIFSGIMIGLGIFGSLVAGLVVDKTKKFEEVAKICFCLSSLSNLFFAVLQGYNNDEGVVKNFMISAFCLIGISGLPLLPICMEMSVECVHNISEATSTGLLLIGGQFVTIIMVMIYPTIAPQVLESSYTFTSVQKCIKTNSIFNTTLSLSVVDYNTAIWNQSGIYLLISVLFIVFYKCPYLRLRSENSKPLKFSNNVSQTVLI
jgi:MFS transporter, FLVCR family, MFS-domain-containing protein 7